MKAGSNSKRSRITFSRFGNFLIGLSILFLGIGKASAQQEIMFSGSVDPYGTNYIESGMHLKLVVPTPGTGSPSFDGMLIVPGYFGNNPTSVSPYMLFFRQQSPDDFVVFNLLSGLSFGIYSVDLADPHAPSVSPVPITFLGFFQDGTSVSQTFSTPGNGATTFQNYTFNTAFASGLTSVEIHASRWAMDNLVFAVPEPGTVSIGLVGLATLALLRRKGIQV